MNSVLINLIIVQFKEFYREPAVLFWGFVFPILLAGVLGIAFLNQPQDKYTVAVVSNSTGGSFLKQFQPEADTFSFDFVVVAKSEALEKFSRGQYQLIIEQQEEEIIFLYDPSYQESEAAFLKLSNLVLKEKVDKVYFKEEKIISAGNRYRYIDFLIPGLIAMSIMNSSLWGIGWNLIDFRIKKLLRRMIATPMSKSTFLFAQIISRGILVFIEAVVIYLFAHILFQVEMTGSFVNFFIVFVSGVITFSGLAILISSRARHSQVGNGIINAVTLPLIILSGIFFSIQNFPGWVVRVVDKLPLTMLADSLRLVFNQAADLSLLWPAISGMIGFGILFFLIGLKIYKWY